MGAASGAQWPRGRLCRAFAIVVVFAAATSDAARADEGTPVDPALLTEIFERGQLQRELPAARERTPRSPRSGGEGEGDPDRSDEARRPPLGTDANHGRITLGDGSVATAVGEAILWTLLVAALVGLVVIVVRNRRPRKTPIARPAAPREEVHAAPPLAAVRDLVDGPLAHGEHLRTVHAMLLDGLRRAHRVSSPDDLPRAATSLELLLRVPHDSAVREPLGVLVALVEEGLFAARPLTPGHVERARTAHAALTSALAGTGRP
jgi:hypothetical protein